MSSPPPIKTKLDIIEEKITKLEDKVKVLENSYLKIEACNTSILQKTNLSNEGSFTKEISVSPNANSLIIGVNFAQPGYCQQGYNHNMQMQIFQKGADQNSVCSLSFSDPHMYCNSMYNEIILPWNAKKESVVIITYNRDWSDTSPYIVVDLVGIIKN